MRKDVKASWPQAKEDTLINPSIRSQRLKDKEAATRSRPRLQYTGLANRSPWASRSASGIPW
ncbi:MAG: hypothetical protein EHM75_13165 [Desulfobacteraceae bacterium]|nr:MAG: hypothetical protein EHM75_13165 [Desulfobacteraceae bacterium]